MKKKEEEQKNENKTGISLIALVISIIVIIILATAIILTINNNNPLEKAKEARLKSDLRSFQDELALYIGAKSSENPSSFQYATLNANEDSLSYNTQVTGEVGNVYTVLPSAKGYQGKIEVVKGKLLFSSKVEKELLIAKELGIDVNIFTIVDGVLQSSNSSLLLVDESGKLEIPDNVTEIGSGAFHDVPNLKKLVIPSNVKIIGENAFSENQALEEVVIEKGVERIGAYAFINCTSIKRITLPDSVIWVGESCFYNNTSLKEVKLSKNINTLPYRFLGSCGQLKSVEIPNGIKKLDSSVFEGDPITSITIPESVEGVNGTFAFMPNLKEIIVDLNNQKFSAEDGILYSKDKSLVISVVNTKTELNISNTTKRIQGGALTGCNAITKINIPASLESVGSLDMYYLRTIIVDEQNLNYSSENGNLYNKNKTVLYRYCQNESTTKVRDGVQTIESNAFYGNPNITAIILPESMQIIKSFALSSNTLEEIILPKNVEKIEASSLNGVKKIKVDSQNPYFKSVEDDTMLLNYAGTLLYRVSNFVSDVTIPNSVTTIGQYAFYYNTNIAEIKIPNTVVAIHSLAFDGCTKLSKVEIPNTVTTIGANAFSRCNSLKLIQVDNVKGSIDGSPWGVPYGERAVVWK